VNGTSWWEIDRQTNNQDFRHLNTTTFALWKSGQFRFIRLTQTDVDHVGGHYLYVRAAEFFGSLAWADENHDGYNDLDHLDHFDDLDGVEVQNDPEDSRNLDVLGLSDLFRTPFE
jgi:hypothetical protein